MGRLLGNENYWKLYWDFRLKNYDSKVIEHEQKEILNFSRQRSFSMKMLEYWNRSYHDYILWEVIYKRFMPETKGAKILEIGSAPGVHLVRLSEKYRFVPYGIERSKWGVELNRKVFSSHNINPDNVIHGDVFSGEVQKNYRGYFDIVISRGFVEDFPDVNAASIVKQHINLLSEGGYLFVMIPNFRGIYYIWARLFDKELLANVNIDIMRKEKFSKLFSEKYLSTLFCDYYGTFNCGDDRFTPSMHFSAMSLVLTFCTFVQRIANVIFRVVLKDKGMESGLFSPYLMFVGVKK